MSKQDRQGVRTPADVERKYNLGALYSGGGGDSTEKLSMQLDQLSKAFSQYVAETNVKIASLENAKYISLEAKGNEIVLTDSDEGTLSGLVFYGNNTQGLEVRGGINLTISGTEEAETQTVTIPIHYALRGIEVTEGGNYIDENGKMWLCDEFDVAKGLYVIRLDENRQPYETPFKYSVSLNVDVETLKTYFPKTTITNRTVIPENGVCGMMVEYAADIKAYIDNKTR